MIKFHMDEDNDVMFEKTYIDAEENANVKLILYYDSVKDLNGYRNAVISVNIAKNAKLELITYRICLMNVGI